jgi:hypothetical protein
MRAGAGFEEGVSMVQVVHAACPGCKKALRMPLGWVGQAMRCKHCGLVMQSRFAGRANAQSAAPPVAVAMPASIPVAVPVGAAPPVSRTNGAAAAAVPASAFADLDAPSPGRRRYRRRSGGCLWVAALFALFLFGGAVALAVFARPYVVQWANSLGQPTAPVGPGPGEPPQVAVIDPSKPPKKPGDDLPVKPPADDPGTKPPSTEPAPKRPPATEPGPKPPRDNDNPPPTKRGPDAPPKNPPNDLPKTAGLFPRRALVVSVNNYLYFNPTNYGKPGPNAHSVHTLLNQLNNGLKVPMTQIVELSDAAPDAYARPPLLSVIRQTVTDFLDTSRPQDRIVVLFIGHAVETADGVFLVPVEGEQDVKETLLPLGWLYDKLKECKARQKVLVLDVCRFNPTRGLERPGSGPVEDAKVPGAMGPKLDEMVQNPPEGVQVWSACVGEQHSHEYDDINLNNGVFADALFETLQKGLEGEIQKPEDPLPLPRMVEGVNKRMKAFLDPFKKTQTSRLAGAEPADGAPYDAAAAQPAKVEIKVPASAGRKQVEDILKELDVPPLIPTKAERPLTARSMPLFSKEVLDAYLPEEPNTDFRKAVAKARQALHDGVQKLRIQEEYRVPANPNQLKDQIKNYQMKELSTVQSELIDAMEELRAVGEKERATESSRRWQANYDYLLARLEAEVAYLYEYQSTLGAMRKEFPPHDPAVHNGWRLASQPNLTGDSAGKKLAASSRKGLEKIAKDYPGTPWEVLAKRDKLTALGLEWQAAKLE